jgi:hypothetical protein
MHRQIGIETLPAQRKADTGIAELSIEVLEFSRPTGRDWRFNPRARRPADALCEFGFDRARCCTDQPARQLRTGELVVAPGKAACRIIKPAIDIIAEAPAHGTEHLQRIIVVRRTHNGRSEVLPSPNHAGKRYVRFDPNDGTGWQGDVVASLNSAEEASVLGERIKRLKEIERAADIRPSARLRR